MDGYEQNNKSADGGPLLRLFNLFVYLHDHADPYAQAHAYTYTNTNAHTNYYRGANSGVTWEWNQRIWHLHNIPMERLCHSDELLAHGEHQFQFIGHIKVEVRLLCRQCHPIYRHRLSQQWHHVLLVGKRLEQFWLGTQF